MRRLIPELEAHLAKLSQRLGKLRHPVHAYIAGGIAVNYHTGARMSDDVDIMWSARVIIPEDLRVFHVPDPEDPSDTILVALDGNFHDYLGSFHPDWKQSAPQIVRFGDIAIHVITPLDLAVSKLGRFAEVDRQDIGLLAEEGLISSQLLQARGREALEYCVGDPTLLGYNLRDAVEMVREIEEKNAAR